MTVGEFEQLYYILKNIEFIRSNDFNKIVTGREDGHKWVSMLVELHKICIEEATNWIEQYRQDNDPR